MSLVPDGKSDKIAFYKTRLDKWVLNASEIGTSVEAVENVITGMTAEGEPVDGGH